MNSWSVLRWEMRLVARERLLPLILITLVLASLVATYTGLSVSRQWHAVATRASQSADDAQAKIATLVASGVSAPGPAQLTASYVRDVPPLTGLATGRAGLDPVIGQAGPTDQVHRLFRDYQADNPWTLAVGRFDWTFFTSVIVPLLIIALGYGLQAQDRDSGLDRQLAVNGQWSAGLMACRVAANGLWLGVPLLVLLVMVGAAVAPSPVALLSIQFVLMAGVAVLSMAFWWGMVALVNTQPWSAVRTAATLIGAWIGLSFAVPPLVNAAALALAPPPSRLALTVAARAAEIEVQSRADSLVTRYVTDHPELDTDPSDANRAVAARFVAALDVDRSIAPVRESFEKALHRQKRIATALQFLSPVSLQQQLMTELAGTGYGSRSSFTGAATQHYQAWRAELASDQIAGRSLSSARLTQLPAVQYESTPLPWLMLGVFFLMAMAPGLAARYLAPAGRPLPQTMSKADLS